MRGEEAGGSRLTRTICSFARLSTRIPAPPATQTRVQSTRIYFPEKFYNGFKLLSSVAKVVKKYGPGGDRDRASGDNQPGTSGTSRSERRREGTSSRPVRDFCARVAESIRETRQAHASAEPILNRLIPASMQGLMSKFKCNGGATNPADDKDTNVILQLYDIGPQVATAGHGLVWRIHDGVRKADSKQVSIFMFDKRIADKLYRPKRKESVLERMRDSVHQVERWRHPKFLTIVHPLEESQQTLAFASEPLIASLHNILTYQESAPLPAGSPPLVFPEPLSLSSGPPPPYSPPERPQFANNYEFCDIELAYGILQLIDALHFMHYTARRVHRNICPQIVLITKRGTWKMFGLEFIEEVHGRDPMDPVPIPPYSVKIARIGQPLLDYMGKPLLDYTAPECQTNAHCTILSDVYSLGLLICAIFNRGKTVIQANNNPILYMKQVENLELAIDGLVRITSRSLREALERMLNKDPTGRPTTQLLPLINYFRYGPIDTKEEEEAQQKKAANGQPQQRNRGPEVIVALQLLDIIQYRDFEIKNHYYRNTLYDALCKIPRKLLWMTIWPYLAGELRAQELAPYVFMPVIWFINMATQEEFDKIIFPSIRACFRKFVNDPTMIKYSYVVLENLHQVLEKCNIDEINVDLLPLLYKALEDPSYQMQLSALICLQTSTEYIMDRAMQYRVTPKIKQIIERSPSNVELINLSLRVYELITKQLDRTQVNESVIPALLAIKFGDPEIIYRTFKLLKDFIDDPRFGISTTTMATKLIPTLTPLTLNNSLNLEQFSAVMELLYQMLDFIDQQQRIMITRPPPPSPTPERRKLRHQMSTDNVAPPFNIPNLRVEKRKTSSAEDMLRKHSIVQQTREQANNEATDNTVAGNFKKMVSGSGFAWIFGSSNSNAGPSTSNDSNFLRVTNVFTNRRLSDNTLVTPKIRVAPSCASSPGGTPGGSNSALPARRHSSIGPQERRGSNINLSPPTAVHHHRGRVGGSGSSLSVPSTSHVGGSMPNTSSSVPQLLTSSMQSIRSRRSSAGPSQSSQGSQGILQQIHSGVVRHLPATPNRSPKTNPSQWNSIQGATSAGYNAIRQTATTAVRKCPSLNISLAN